ncbi:MAG TPA: cytochrome c [Acidimicrobiia bacterium]|nr:cytochrome c [Acidimicrobiia bacterium]
MLGGLRSRYAVTPAALVAALTVTGSLAVAGCGGGSSSSPSNGPPAPKGAQAHDAALVRGRGVYRSFCAECHGMQGQGGTGPKLAGGAVKRAFPNVDDQVALVESGRGSMPAWKGRLTDQQINDVVRYEREVL